MSRPKPEGLDLTTPDSERETLDSEEDGENSDSIKEKNESRASVLLESNSSSFEGSVNNGENRRLFTINKIRYASSSSSKLSTKSRAMPEVPLPLSDKLTRDGAFRKSGAPNIPVLKEHLKREGRLELQVISEILDRASELLAKDSNLIRLDGTVKVVGALCGHFYDLLTIWDNIQPISSNKCVFLGNYINDGDFGVEVVLFLLALKIAYPLHIFLLRGCQDCRHSSKVEFKSECKAKYDENVYHSIMSAFDFLPLAALVNTNILCVHGGISPLLRTLDNIEEIFRVREPPARGLLTDLLWADPVANYGIESMSSPFYSPNEERAVSFYFSSHALYEFVKSNSLIAVVRTHQPLSEGFHFYEARNFMIGKYIALVSLFSTPNFQGRRNKGAILTLTPDSLSMRQFLWSPEPYWLPCFEDAFTWSLPYVVKNVTSLITGLFKALDRPNCMEEMKEEQRKREMAKKKHEIMMKGHQLSKHTQDPREKSTTHLPFESEANVRRKKALALAQNLKIHDMHKASNVRMFQTFHRLQRDTNKTSSSLAYKRSFMSFDMSSLLRSKESLHGPFTPDRKGSESQQSPITSVVTSRHRIRIQKWLERTD